MKNTKIAIDFDGTIVQHEFPDIGPPGINAFYWMKKWKEHGAKLMLWTMRSDGQKQKYPNVLSDAVNFCKNNGIEFDSVNKGIGDRAWTSSPKINAKIYIDDAAFGVPMRKKEPITVDWDIIGPKVLEIIEDRKRI